MLGSTPKTITPEIRKFCVELARNSNPVYVRIANQPNSIINECFTNVENFIHKNGGTAQLGWRFWEYPNLFLEAQFHCIWQSPDGEYLDVSPENEDKILFLPDFHRKYEGKQVKTEFFKLTNNQLVSEYISNFNRYFEMLNKGQLENYHGLITMPMDFLIAYQKRQAELLLLMATASVGPNDPCYCGSGRKFKKCHRNI